MPLDYAKPDGAAIKLAVLKVPAQGERVGALVVNPGGPGGSGVDYAAAGSLQFGTPLTRDYDIVGFDPRGVGQSNPLKCVDTAQLDAFLALDPDPDDPGRGRQARPPHPRFGAGLPAKSGDLTRHISTDEAARDMDILRAALGERQLDYLGASYGTLLGATYADLFPTHVGRLVLDGAIDPSLSNEQLSLEQAHGFETALRAYVEDCVDAGQLLPRRHRRGGGRADPPAPRRASTRSRCPPTTAVSSPRVWRCSASACRSTSRSYWPLLTAALKQALEERRRPAAAALADTYTSRGPNGYTDNSIEALYAVNCLDHDDSIPTSEVPQPLRRVREGVADVRPRVRLRPLDLRDWPVKSGERDRGAARRRARRRSWSSARPATRRRRTPGPRRWPASWTPAG